MTYQSSLRPIIGVTLIAPFLVGCGASVPTPAPVPPIASPIPPTDTATALPPVLAPTAMSADGSWTTLADMPTGRWELSTCVVDGKIYAIGGAGPVHQALGTVEAYDPATDTWTTKSEMPIAGQGLSTSALDGKIYAIGGYVPDVAGHAGVDTVEVYDPAKDAWTTAHAMPTGRFGLRTSVVGGKIYVIGGMDKWVGSAYRTVLEYDP